VKHLFFALVLGAISISAFGQAAPKESVMIQIRGQITFSDGRRAGEGAVVQLLPSAGGISQEAQSDRTGKFSFIGLSPIRYTVRVRMPGYMDAEETFDMSIMSSAFANLALRPTPGSGPAPAAGIVSVLPSDMPESAKTEFNAGYTIITSGKDLGKAVSHFKKVIEQYPSYAPAHLLLGTAYSRTDKFDDAVEPLKKAAELDPKSADAYSELGRVYNNEKKFSEAEQSLTKAIELAPTSYDAQYQLGRACFAQQRPQEAQPHVAAALKADPNSAEAHILMGNVMLRMRNADGALSEYKEALRLDPKGPMSEPTRQMVAKIETALKAGK
jgi:tetratricopeptide (TPR) repeat protein